MVDPLAYASIAVTGINGGVIISVAIDRSEYRVVKTLHADLDRCRAL